MKKTFALLLAVVMILALTSCNTAEPVSPAGSPSAGASQPPASGQPEPADAGKFPNEPITILVGFSAGGSTDLGSRYMAKSLEKILGVSVVVENVPGSSGWVAINQLMHNTAADGYTIGIMNHAFPLGKYDDTAPRSETLDDVELLINQVIDYNVLCIRNDETRFSDLESFLEYAKENPILATATSVGILDGDATCMEWLKQTYDSQFTIVPVDSGADGRTMFLAGDIDIYMTSTADVYLAHQQGEFQVICQFSEERTEWFPDTPTMKEIYPDNYWVGYSNRGFFYPKGVEPAIVELVKNAMLEAMEDPDQIENLEVLGLTPYPLAGEEYVDLLSNQLERKKAVWGITE